MSKYQDLLPLRDQVLFELGRCVMNLQSVEQLLKLILQSAHKTNRPSRDAKRTELISGSTLGGLKTDFFETYLLAHEREHSDLKDDDPPFTFSVRTTEVLPPEVRAKKQESLCHLISARNELIHHFQSKHDLNCEGCCEAALKSLKGLNAQAIEMIDDLRATRETQIQTSFRALELMQSDAWLNLVTGKPLPPGHGWLMVSEIIQLIEAIELHGANGKAELAKGVEYLASKGTPNDAYKNYGCQSWQDLLSKTGVFHLEKRKNPTTGQWVRYYQVQPNALPEDWNTSLAVGANLSSRST